MGGKRLRAGGEEGDAVVEPPSSSGQALSWLNRLSQTDFHKNQRGLSFTPCFPGPAEGTGASGEPGPSFSNLSKTHNFLPKRSHQHRAQTFVCTALNGCLCFLRENYQKNPHLSGC